MNIPNLLTLLRIALIPVLVLFFYIPGHWTHVVCASIFALAALSDWADGFLARKLGQLSAFGEFIDPVADKLIVSVSLVILVGAFGSAVIAIPAAVIVGRELVISALREWMAEVGKRNDVAVSWLGKVKTCVQMFSIICLFVADPHQLSTIYALGLLSLWFAAGLTLWSMGLYLRAAKDQFGQSSSSE